MTCRYLTAPAEALIIGPGGERAVTDPADMPPGLRLCTWADDSAAGIKALTDAPRWLQREALSGHLWREGDCEGCPGFCAR